MTIQSGHEKCSFYGSVAAGYVSRAWIVLNGYSSDCLFSEYVDIMSPIPNDQLSHVTGVVISNCCQPSASATIRLQWPGGDIVRTTDRRGYFLITGVPSGATEFSVTKSGRTTCEHQLDVAQGEDVRLLVHQPPSTLVAEQPSCAWHLFDIGQFYPIRDAQSAQIVPASVRTEQQIAFAMDKLWQFRVSRSISELSATVKALGAVQIDEKSPEYNFWERRDVLRAYVIVLRAIQEASDPTLNLSDPRQVGSWPVMPISRMTDPNPAVRAQYELIMKSNEAKMRRATYEAQLRNWDAFAVGYLTTMLTVYKSFNTPSDTELRNILDQSGLTDSDKEMIGRYI